MTAPNTFTELSITGLAAPYAVRGLTQSLDPIQASSQLRRTINGNLKDLSGDQFRKFKSTITCGDMRAPALDGVWPGKVLTVDCAAHLSYETGGSPSRVVVPGSSFTEQGFVYYRPRLTMRVVSYNTSEDEYGAVNSWTLELEEI